ncbi:hypothetical protein NLU13_2914 [Sarocladium strictum]|uniref:Aminoglycoside phosphotransferase domain-containing protein n=1 Tax=Sarocladium strictum TaxID=5046 RepID=A0AA39GLV4_SARSR|nr:hypothetical protein NLU13_2914 [Sarocladium strictum]
MSYSNGDDGLHLDKSGERLHVISPSTETSDNIDAFFRRNGFHVETRAICDKFARDRFPSAIVDPIPSQGYCSYTLRVGSDKVLQFRPDAFPINVGIIPEGRKTLGNLVPGIEGLGEVHGIRTDQDDQRSDELSAFLLDRVAGITLEDLHLAVSGDEKRMLHLKRRLVSDLAVVFGKTYLSSRAVSPKGINVPQKGKVGSSLAWRVRLLQGVVSEEVSTVLAQVRGSLSEIENLPWCLTHGDLVPANIMLDPSTGRLCGLIDWAEGEYLPFGVGLYGLEEVLGTTQGGHFQYHSFHRLLRAEFWLRFHGYLCGQGVHIGTSEFQCIMLARKLGILLWRGIAFAEGRIDRVVEVGVDDGELHKLHLFLAEDDVTFTGGCGENCQWSRQIQSAPGCTRKMSTLVWKACSGVFRGMRALYQSVQASLSLHYSKG